jgi:adenosylhomocysteine nucleosidase
VGAQPLAIVSAMQEELHALIPLLDEPRRVKVGARQFHLGSMHGHAVVLARSGIGKVAAAITATLAIQHFNAHSLVFTGVAGGLGKGVKIGDLVLARELLQHDLDATPLFPRFEVPLTGVSRFSADGPLSGAVLAAVQRCLQRGAIAGAPKLHQGLVISGDRFIATAAHGAELRSALPDALAVEMEGAAVAQVCHAFGVPLAVLRIISDRADDAAHTDFAAFMVGASAATRSVIEDWLRAWPRG